MHFTDRDGDQTEIEVGEIESNTVVVRVYESRDVACNVFDVPTARAVAAEIIACADRIEGKVAPARDEVNPFCIPQVDTLETLRVIKESLGPSTPTHTSHEALVSLAKAIAYLPGSLRDELNALLAEKLRVALK